MRIPCFGIRVSGLGFSVLTESSTAMLTTSVFRVSGFRIRVPYFGIWVSLFGFRDSGFGIQVPESSIRASGFEFRDSIRGVKGYRGTSLIRKCPPS